MTAARRRFERRTHIDTRGLDHRQARRLMRRHGRRPPPETPQRCKAFDTLDLTCLASDPCALHGCDDTDDGCTSAGCFCDPERGTPPGRQSGGGA